MSPEVTMSAVLAALVLATASPSADGAPGVTAERAADAGALRLGVPTLRLDAAAPSLALEGGVPGGGAGAGGVDPVVPLVLGIFPGFGLGHYVAGSPRWTTWLIVDAALLGALIVVSAADADPLDTLAWVATIVERVFEGIEAYRAAGGRMATAGPPARVRLARDAARPGPAAGLILVRW
jgi:hypothetical protein